MARRQLFVTQFDRDRLRELLDVAEARGEHHRPELQQLKKELAAAAVVDPTAVPPTVVTMNSKVRLRDAATSEEMVYTLVFPDREDSDAGRLSVLAPIGTAVLGYREGDVVEWTVPAGRRQITIEKVLYQPEAAGDFRL
jgi:regulator of nucleoside diphosphate kinase